MSSIKSRWTRRVTLALLAIGGLFGALAVACGGGDPEIVTVVETVVVDRPVTQIETVIETVVVERQVTQIEKVIETVVVEREVTRTEKVVETVVVEKVVEGQIVKVIETVIVDRPVTRTEKVVETVVVERPVTRTVKVVQTVIVPQVVVATAAPPTPEPPSQTLVVALNNIAFPTFVPSRSPYPNSQIFPNMGILETAFESKTDGALVNVLAESWEFNEDFTQLTFQLKRGVQFHRDNGEFTADDFVFTWENAFWTEGTIASGSGLPKLLNAHMTKTDDYTVVLTTDEPWPTALETFVNPDTSRGVVSKALFESLGAEAATSEAIGTGPYQVEEYKVGERIVMSAVPDHHHNTAPYATVIVREIAEPTTRIAALAAREVDVTDVPAPLIKDVEGFGFDVRALPGAGAGFSLYPTGLFCWETYKGEPVPPRPGYKPDLPYIGACDDPDSLERARKVRWALSMAVDRNALVETIGTGLAFPQHVHGQGATQRQQWLDEIEEKWTIPYDLDMARQYLAEGGYPDGFTADLVISTGNHALEIEVGEAVAGMWKAIGVDMNLETLTYQAHRVGLVNRERSNWWLWARDHGVDGTGIFGRHPGGAFNPGFELPDLFDLLTVVRTATTPDGLRAAQEAVWDYTNHNMVSIETMGMARTIATNPAKIKDWPMGLGTSPFPRHLDRIVRP
jgi:peptide/nickel transport system substrate-binding protein